MFLFHHILHFSSNFMKFLIDTVIADIPDQAGRAYFLGSYDKPLSRIWISAIAVDILTCNPL